MPLPVPRLRTVVTLHEIEQAVDCRPKQPPLPLAVTLKAPRRRRRYSLAGTGASKRRQPQDFYIQPQKDLKGTCHGVYHLLTFATEISALQTQGFLVANTERITSSGNKDSVIIEFIRPFVIAQQTVFKRI